MISERRRDSGPTRIPDRRSGEDRRVRARRASDERRSGSHKLIV